MRRKFFLLLGILFFCFGSFSKGIFAYEGDISNTEDFSYFFINYNGEKQKIIFNENVTLALTGWTDESKSSVNGKIDIHADSTNLTEDITIKVTDELNEIAVKENEIIQFRIAVSDFLKLEEVHPLRLQDQISVVSENENGTSIEEVKTIDEYGTVIDKKGLTYYSTAENQKMVISKEEYDSLNPDSGSSAVIQSSENTVLANEGSTEEVTPLIHYAAHVQDIGWQNTVSDGELAGTNGLAKRIEAVKIFLENAPYSGGVSYKTHVQDYGWLDSVSDGKISGTTGKGKQAEAILMNLTGEMANHYDIYYRVHSQDYGWLDWAKNGESAGTERLAKQLEAIEIVLVKKGGKAPGSTDRPFLIKQTVRYSTHVETYGWMGYVANGKMSGTQGEAKRIEAIKIDLQAPSYSGDITYSTHVQDYGWMASVSNGEISGTTGKGKQAEAIQVNLSGDMAKHYDIYYRVHSQDFGWLGWAKNGESAGTEGLAKQLEAIEIVIVEKGGKAPGSTEKPLLTKPIVVYSTHVETYGWLDDVSNGKMSGTKGQAKRLEAIKIDLQNANYSGDIIYSTHVQDYGWLNNVSNGIASGTVGKAKRVEAIKIDLTGEIAKYFDIYYRVHAQDFGWLGWAKNGMKAGSEGISKRLEAIEIKLVPKGQGEPVNEITAFKQPITVFLDPGHGGSDPGAIAGGYHEADLNLSVAKKAKALLVNRGFRVIMSRNSDTTVELLDRPRMTNNSNADIFVSIHTNSTGEGITSALGIEGYYYEYDPYYPSKINSTMHNNPERISKSMTLANLIQGIMVDYTGANNRGTDGASFQVIREAAMPATLVEIGFINNAGERQKLITDSYQNKLAQAVADGIEKYFKMY